MSFSSNPVDTFRQEVVLKYQLFNSLFTSLPFHKIEKTGILLSLLSSQCEDGYGKGMNPKEILDFFFKTQTDYTNEKTRCSSYYITYHSYKLLSISRSQPI